MPSERYRKSNQRLGDTRESRCSRIDDEPAEAAQEALRPKLLARLPDSSSQAFG